MITKNIIDSNIEQFGEAISKLGNQFLSREKIPQQIPPIEFRCDIDLEIGYYNFKIGNFSFYGAKVYPDKIDQSGNLWYKSCWYNWSAGVEESTPATNRL